MTLEWPPTPRLVGPPSSWPGASGPPHPARAAIDSPDAPGHDGNRESASTQTGMISPKGDNTGLRPCRVRHRACEPHRRASHASRRSRTRSTWACVAPRAAAASRAATASRMCRCSSACAANCRSIVLIWHMRARPRRSSIIRASNGLPLPLAMSRWKAVVVCPVLLDVDPRVGRDLPCGGEQRLDVRGRHLLRGQGGGLTFEQPANREDFHQLIQRDLAHDKSAAGGALDEAFALQPVDGRAQWRTGGTERVGQPAFGEQGAGWHFPGEDPASQNLVGGLRKAWFVAFVGKFAAVGRRCFLVVPRSRGRGAFGVQIQGLPGRKPNPPPAGYRAGWLDAPDGTMFAGYQWYTTCQDDGRVRT